MKKARPFPMLECREGCATVGGMSTLAEIEEAIATLPASEVERLTEWLARQRVVLHQPVKPEKREAVAAFLRRWTGAGIASTTDDELRAQRTTRLLEKHVK